MDGNTFCSPFSKRKVTAKQLSLFEEDNKPFYKPLKSKIFDWEEDKEVVFEDLIRKVS